MTTSYRDQYMPTAQKAAAQYGVPLQTLVAMLDEETGGTWDPNLVSPAGAIGTAQFMPGTAKDMGIDPHDPEQSIMGAAHYLAGLQQYFGGDLRKAVAAYNAGGARVKDAVFTDGDNWESKLPQETQKYLTDVFSPQAAPPSGTGATANQPGALVQPTLASYEIKDPTTGQGTGQYDYSSYYDALNAYETLQKSQQGDYSQYLQAAVSDISNKLEQGRLTLDAANDEFQKRMDAWDQASTRFDNLIGYAIPQGAQYYPGTKDSVGQTMKINPFAEAMDLVNGSSDFTTLVPQVNTDPVALARQFAIASLPTPAYVNGISTTAPARPAPTISGPSVTYSAPIVGGASAATSPTGGAIAPNYGSAIAPGTVVYGPANQLAQQFMAGGR